MNREILFRGKRLDNGEWVYGDLENCKIRQKSFIHTYMDDGKYHCQFEVDPATVGQYTGLTDKNGKEIFEGDLVSYTIVTGGIEDLEKIAHVAHIVEYDNEHAAFKIGYHYACKGTMEEVVNAKNLVVLGNCFDNPDMLKGGEE